MKRLKKSTVFALKEYVRLYSTNMTVSQKQAMLEEAIKNFELIANDQAGHTCYITIGLKRDRSYFEFHYVYEFPINHPLNHVVLSPDNDFEEVYA
ncbi:hypothetical protein [uncultured Parasutterella sp.]|uniref:hypothetical protein n=1 Tax=uncultured Parasutterella sp. TaxID=1263098 RepID=UPI0026238EC2|nr:hypothetical protein [uncultured Parasutterella sp.]